jgi:hypothetical protein
VVALALRRRAVEARHRDAVAGDGDDLVLAELERLVGVLDERRHVGAQEVLALAEADDQRAVAPGRDDPLGIAGVGGDEGERALQPAAHPLHRGGEVGAAVELDLQQVRRDLGVGLRAQRVPGPLQVGAQLGEVLDDPVVHDRDPPLRAEVRVGVDVGRPAVGRPARVADAGRRGGERILADQLLQIGQLPGPLPYGERLRGSVDQGDPGRVVAAVLHPPQPLDHDLLSRTTADVAHDPAHSDSSYRRGPHPTAIRACCHNHQHVDDRPGSRARRAAGGLAVPRA